MGRLHRSVTKKNSRKDENRFQSVLGQFWLLMCSEARDSLHQQTNVNPKKRLNTIAKRSKQGGAE
jgi:hypothetical protein